MWSNLPQEKHVRMPNVEPLHVAVTMATHHTLFTKSLGKFLPVQYLEYIMY